MAPVTNLVSVEDYLATDYMPNAEYEDGVVRHKSMPTYLHNRIARELMLLIMKYNPTLDAVQEQHVQIREGKYLIPDVLAQYSNDIQSPYVNRPVPLCAEVLSPQDTISQVFAKCEEYHRWGVPTVWVVDPQTRLAWIYSQGGVPHEVSPTANLVAENLSIPLAEVFRGLPL